MPKMSSLPHRTSSSDSDSLRKRVGKACDRCRLKKSKCDGSSPCSRCKADNAICVFGERKKSHDKIYPKGYVEMLEQQQSQLVTGLQETYRRLLAAQLWPGAPLVEHNGNPLTHDILAVLDLLEPKQDGSAETEVFEEDCHKLQQRLISDGAPLVGRRGSFSSESDHDPAHGHGRGDRHARTSSHASHRSTPAPPQRQPVFEEGWDFRSSPSPITLSPPPKMTRAQQLMKASPLSNEPVSQDDYSVNHWQNMVSSAGLPEGFVRSQFALQAPAVQDNLQTMMDNYSQALDTALDSDNGSMMFNQTYNQNSTFGMYNPQDWLMNEAMDVDFSKFVQVST